MREAAATHGATMVGTFGYAPVEQLGGTADERSDLYGLGATLVHAVTGIPPAELLTPSLAIEYSRHAEVSPTFAAFLSALTAPQREGRPADVEAALGLLRSDSLAHQSSSFGGIAPHRSWKSVARGAAVGLLVGAAVAFIADAVLSSGWRSTASIFRFAEPVRGPNPPPSQREWHGRPSPPPLPRYWPNASRIY